MSLPQAAAYAALLNGLAQKWTPQHSQMPPAAYPQNQYQHHMRHNKVMKKAENNPEKPGFLHPRASEVVAAVESLYADRLKPFGRILLKRIRERSAAAATAAARAAGSPDAVIDAESMPLIDPRGLRRVCETCERLQVQSEEGKEYSVLLIGRRQDFVDVISPCDPYPAAMWEQIKDYFENLGEEEMALPGGRYACAQVLLTRQLPFLAGRSLGEVCHIVQVAVSQRRILGYLDGNMVPFGRSVDCMKEQCAVWQQPVATSKVDQQDIRLATWEEARVCLWEILTGASVDGGPGAITLSNVKRLFRSRYGLELSETVLGHSRLLELLQDPRFSDICYVETQGKGQVVVQKVLRTQEQLCAEAYLAGAAAAAAAAAAAPWAAGMDGSPYNLCGANAPPPGFFETTRLSSLYQDAPDGLGQDDPSTFLSPDDAASGLNPDAAPWSPMLVPDKSEAKPQSEPLPAGRMKLKLGDALPELTTVADDEPAKLSLGAGTLLSSYVQQLLEMETDEGRDTLRALSTYQAAASTGKTEQESLEAPKIGGFSRCSSASASRSTSDGASAGPHSDGDDASDDVGATGRNKIRGAAAAPFLPPPPGLAPPPGL